MFRLVILPPVLHERETPSFWPSNLVDSFGVWSCVQPPQILGKFLANQPLFPSPHSPQLGVQEISHREFFVSSYRQGAAIPRPKLPPATGTVSQALSLISTIAETSWSIFGVLCSKHNF